MGANNNEYHAENPNFLTRNLSRLKENGKLAFRKYFDLNIFRKMFKRNDISMDKSRAVIVCSRNGIIILLTYGRNGNSGIIRNIFSSRNKGNRTHLVFFIVTKGVARII